MIIYKLFKIAKCKLKISKLLQMLIFQINMSYIQSTIYVFIVSYHCYAIKHSFSIFTSSLLLTLLWMYLNFEIIKSYLFKTKADFIFLIGKNIFSHIMIKSLLLIKWLLISTNSQLVKVTYISICLLTLNN